MGVAIKGFRFHWEELLVNMLNITAVIEVLLKPPNKSNILCDIKAERLHKYIVL
jgi:hypothetical protein